MGSFTLALKEVEKQVKHYEAFKEAQNALIALASMEQHTEELNGRKSVLEASVADLNTQIKNKQEKIKSLDARLTAVSSDIETALSTERQRQIDLLAEEMSKKRAEEEEKISLLKEETSNLKRHIEGHEVYLKAKQSEITILETKIAEAKVQIQRILNGNV